MRSQRLGSLDSDKIDARRDIIERNRDSRTRRTEGKQSLSNHVDKADGLQLVGLDGDAACCRVGIEGRPGLGGSLVNSEDGDAGRIAATGLAARNFIAAALVNVIKEHKTK